MIESKHHCGFTSRLLILLEKKLKQISNKEKGAILEKVFYKREKASVVIETNWKTGFVILKDVEVLSNYNPAIGINLCVLDSLVDFTLGDRLSVNLRFTACSPSLFDSIELSSDSLVNYLESQGFVETNTEWWFYGELIIEEVEEV